MQLKDHRQLFQMRIMQGLPVCHEVCSWCSVLVGAVVPVPNYDGRTFNKFESLCWPHMAHLFISLSCSSQETTETSLPFLVLRGESYVAD